MTELEQQILTLENRWWKTAAAKDEAIRALGLTPVRYYQLLAGMLDRQDVLATDPMLVNRLRRIRDTRSEARRRRGLS